MPFRFDYQLTIGNIIVMLTLLVAMLANYHLNITRISTLEIRTDTIELQQQLFRAEISELKRDQRDSYLSKDVADRLINQLDRIETRLERIEQQHRMFNDLNLLLPYSFYYSEYVHK
ncbi:MAG: hypothetical protein LAT67_05160 [Balneolales bacterium]|nr:hypothetical protein [Balneolales bacterium]